jgi:hypothetical protein
MSGGLWALNIPERRCSVTVSTAIYLVVRAGFGAGSAVTGQGHRGSKPVVRAARAGNVTAAAPLALNPVGLIGGGTQAVATLGSLGEARERY